jgi:ABC-type nitrate/sulfonate/bicarbonate transport system substrate-binding protein
MNKPGLYCGLVWLFLMNGLFFGCNSVPTPAPSLPPASPLTIYAPASPSSIPGLLAAKTLPNTEVVIFTDHSQANTLFLRGDVPMLVTGLSVGVELFKNDAPVQIINSYVSDLTWLATYGQPVASLAELKGQDIYLPFEGSPIEEMTRFLAEQEGLVWKEDIRPVYSPFPASVELLKQGKAKAVVLPEPFVSLVGKEPQVHVSLNYRQQWDALTGSANGYPQVGTFVTRDWAAAHPHEIAQFNQALAQAVQAAQQDPAAAIEQTAGSFKFPPPVLLTSLKRTGFVMLAEDNLKTAVENYYQTIGAPLDEKFGPFFYRHP